MAIPSLNIGGGKWATKQDKLLAYKQNIGGRYFAINGDTSRNSTATFTNQNGLIESVGNNVARVDFQDDVKGSLLLEPQSTNLITQSESFGNSYWTKSGASIQGDPSTAGSEEVVNGDFATDSDWNKNAGWTISGGSAICDGVGTNSMLQSIPTNIGKTYLLSFNVLSIANSSGFRIINEGFSDTYVLGNQISVGLNVFYFIPTMGTGIRFRLTNGTTTTIDNVSVKEVQGFASPSLDSPTGAFKLVEGTSSGIHYLRANTSVITGVEHTMSFYLKAAESQFIQMLFGTGAFGVMYANFDLTNGLVTVENGCTATISLLSNGFYRCSITATSIATQSASCYLIKVATGTSSRVPSYTGDGTSGIYIYGAQVEALPYATSYIPTSGSAVTRVKDVATDFGDVNSFNSEEGVLFVEGSFSIGSANGTGFSLSDGTNNTVIKVYVYSGVLYIDFKVNSVLQSSFLSSDYTLSLFNKFAISFKDNDFNIYINGIKVHTDLIVDIPTLSLFNEFIFKGNPSNSSSIFNGKVKQVQVYKEALTDAQLQELTSHLSYNSLAVSLNFNI